VAQFSVWVTAGGRIPQHQPLAPRSSKRLNLPRKRSFERRRSTQRRRWRPSPHLIAAAQYSSCGLATGTVLRRSSTKCAKSGENNAARARKLAERAVTHQLDQSPAVCRQLGRNCCAVFLEPLQRAGLVALHKRSVAGNVRRKDHGELALHMQSIADARCARKDGHSDYLPSWPNLRQVGRHRQAGIGGFPGGPKGPKFHTRCDATNGAALRTLFAGIASEIRRYRFR
jgi:hypothetical protein